MTIGDEKRRPKPSASSHRRGSRSSSPSLTAAFASAAVACGSSSPGASPSGRCPTSSGRATTSEAKSGSPSTSVPIPKACAASRQPRVSIRKAARAGAAKLASVAPATATPIARPRRRTYQLAASTSEGGVPKKAAPIEIGPAKSRAAARIESARARPTRPSALAMTPPTIIARTWPRSSQRPTMGPTRAITSSAAERPPPTTPRVTPKASLTGITKVPKAAKVTALPSACAAQAATRMRGPRKPGRGALALSAAAAALTEAAARRRARRSRRGACAARGVRAPRGCPGSGRAPSGRGRWRAGSRSRT